MPAKKPKKKVTKGPDLERELRSGLLKLRRLKIQKADLDLKKKELNEKIEPLEKEMFDTMQALGIQNMKMNNSTFFVTSKVYFSVADKQKALAWVKKKYPEILNFNISTMTSILKSEFLEKHKVIPKFFNKFDKESVGIRNANQE